MRGDTMLIVGLVVVAAFVLTSDARAAPASSPSNPPENNTEGARQNQAPTDLYAKIMGDMLSLAKDAMITVGKQTSEGR